MIRHRGFTIVEALVTLSVLGLLIGLLLPAVQAARESARRVQCQNNLKQIGLSVHSFESAFRALPSNGWGFRWIADPSRGYGPSQPGGWIYHIAPFCELALPEGGSADPFIGHDIRTALSVTPFAMMRCPSRPGGVLQPASLDPRPVNAAFMAAVPKTDYAANEGDFVTGTLAGPSSLSEGDHPQYDWTPMGDASGVIFQRSRIAYSQITDGLSHTYVCGEKYVSSRNYYDAGDKGHDQSLFSGVDIDLNRWTIEPPSQDGKVVETQIFGSPHAGGAYMTMCDGSVNLVSFAVDPHVHLSRGNRHDAR